MEGLLAVALGVCAAAAVPFVPALRPVAKAAVKGGLALADVATSAVALTGYGVSQLVHSVSSRQAATEESIALGDEGMVVAAEDEVAAVSAAPVETSAEAEAEVGIESVAETDMSEAQYGSTPEPRPQETPTIADAIVEDMAVEDMIIEDMTIEDMTIEDMTIEDMTIEEDDERPTELVLINGIGPKTAAVLQAAGVTSMEQLAEMDEAQLRAILADAGARYRAMDPSSWPDQAHQLLESAFSSTVDVNA